MKKKKKNVQGKQCCKCFLSTGEAGKRRASQMRNRTITIKSVESFLKKDKITRGAPNVLG